MIERARVRLSDWGKEAAPRTRTPILLISAVVIFLVVFSLTLSAPVVAAPAAADGHSNAEPQSQQEQLGSDISQQNTTITGSAVTFENQTSNGSTVTIESVTLSEPGYVAVHSSGYATGPAPAEYSIIAVSDRLSTGRHQNITIDISNAPPANAPGLNRSQLNTTQTLAATVHQDTNGNQQFDFVQSAGEDDAAFLTSGDVVSDIARVTVPTPPPQTASVVFRNQTVRNNTVTVQKARLPRGGFLIAHNASYRRTGDAVTSAVGLSRYLPPGNYTNVSLRVVSGALSKTQIVTIRPSLDTNDNRQYDYITSGGFQDVAYETDAGVVTDPAVVSASGSEQPALTRTATQTRATTQTPTLAGTTPTTGATASRTTTASGGVEGSDALLGLSWIQLGIGGLVVLIVLLSVIQRLR
jgi:hypothetical protein